MYKLWNKLLEHEIVTRIIFGILLIIIFGGAMTFRYPSLVHFLILAGAIGLNFEYYALLAKRKIFLWRSMLGVPILILISLPYLGLALHRTLLVVAGLLLILLVLFLIGQFFLKDLLAKVEFYLLHFVWIVLPTLFFFLLTHIENGKIYLSFLALIVASNDIFAYFVGKTWGRHKLAVKISPKKTIEGSLAGLIGGGGLGFLINYFFPVFGSYEVLFISGLIIISAQIGDLLASHFKRLSKAKDSGSIIPGHGGILDRLDGFLPAIWVLFGYLYLVKGVYYLL